MTPTTTLKLSDAIRLGAMLGPQVFGKSFSGTGDGGSCALGAADLAIGRTRLLDAFPWAFKPVKQTVPLDLIPDDYPCPEDNLTFLIAYLNDHKRWTRERIADWVASLEPANPPRACQTDDAPVPQAELLLTR